MSTDHEASFEARARDKRTDKPRPAMHIWGDDTDGDGWPNPLCGASDISPDATLKRSMTRCVGCYGEPAR